MGELGRTIDSPAHDGTPTVWPTPMVDEELGPTIPSPEDRPARRLGLGDTIVLSPRDLVKEFGFLVVWSGPRTGDIFKLDHFRNVIGRDRGVQVFVDDSHASGKHASIRCEKMGDKPKGQSVLRDLDSENGTWINGNRISAETVLADGDIIRIGKTDLVFKRI